MTRYDSAAWAKKARNERPIATTGTVALTEDFGHGCAFEVDHAA
ncbi:hypothetical protein [Nereida sp. MMG025]|nr:hypothetical protein [Nereida sp. MMG025]